MYKVRYTEDNGHEEINEYESELDAEMAIEDELMYNLYTVSNVDEVMEFDDFENFMYEYIV